jgi:hypothetical protein
VWLVFQTVGNNVVSAGIGWFRLWGMCCWACGRRIVGMRICTFFPTLAVNPPLRLGPTFQPTLITRSHDPKQARRILSHPRTRIPRPNWGTSSRPRPPLG